jgi:hypothetical protein
VKEQVRQRDRVDPVHQREQVQREAHACREIRKVFGDGEAKPAAGGDGEAGPRRRAPQEGQEQNRGFGPGLGKQGFECRSGIAAMTVLRPGLVSEVFELRRSFEWRGLGQVPYSALRIREAYVAFDAERRFDLETRSVADNKACECGAILRGVKHPRDCKVFGTVCTPENPIGSCMVSSEGACAAHFSYGRWRRVPVVTA